MLAIDFKAPVDVTITFEDSDDGDINDCVDKEREVKKNNTHLHNQQGEQISQNVGVNKSEDSCKKYYNTISPKSNIARKRKLDSQCSADTAMEKTAKHTIITTTQGQTHIVVAPPINSSPPTNETNNTNQYLDNLLKTVSVNLILIMEASQKFAQEKSKKEIQEELFKMSYSTVHSIIIPQENDMLFVTRFLKDTLRLCKEKNTIKITNEQQIYPFYSEMLEWTKKKQKQLEEMIFVNCKEQHQMKMADRPTHSIKSMSCSSRNPSDDSNTQLVTLLQQSEPRRNANVSDFSKNTTMGNTNIPYEYVSSNPSITTSSYSRPVVPPIPAQVTNSMHNSFSLQRTPCSQNQYQQIQHSFTQMATNGQNPYRQSQQLLPQMTPSSQKSYQRTQSSNPQIQNISQSPYPYTQQCLTQPPRGNLYHTMTNFQKVSQHAQFDPRDTRINAGFAAQPNLRENRNGLNQASGNATSQIPIKQPAYQNSFIQTGTDCQALGNATSQIPVQQLEFHRFIQTLTDRQASGNATSQIPAQQPAYQNSFIQTGTDRQTSGNKTSQIPVQPPAYQNSFIQTGTDRQHMQWAPNKLPPPYAYCQPPKSSNKEQQLTQAAQRGMPFAQRQQQAELQQPEITRSVSTDSGIVSPLPFFNPTDATSNYHLAEDEQPTPLITHVTSLNPNVSYNNDGKCSVCFKITNLKCLCLEKYYCSYDCQESDWSNHKMKCSTNK